MDRNAVKFCVMSLLLVVLAGCGGGGGSSSSRATSTTPSIAVSGVAQGPIVSGTVTIQGVDASLATLAASAPVSTTTSVIGVFAASAVAGSTVDLTVKGKYWDEVYAVSTGTLTLGSYASGSDAKWNVNVLTTLAQQRIDNLVNNCSMSFQQARILAEQEVLAAFYIRDQNTYNFGSLDLSTWPTVRDEDHILAAITSVFESNGSGNPLQQVSNLITSFQNEIAPNSCNALTSKTINALNSREFLDSATANTLEINANGVSPTKVASNLTTEYKSAPIYTAVDISDWLDQDGDHVIGRYKYKAVQAPLTQGSIIPIPLQYTFPLYTVGLSDDGATYSFGADVIGSSNVGIGSPGKNGCKVTVAGGVPSNSTVVHVKDSVQVVCNPAAHEVSSTYLLNGPSGTGIPIARYDFTPFAITNTPMTTAVTYTTATTLLDGTVLVAGGLVSGTASVATAIAELYDPGKGSWTAVPSMKSARAGHTATLLNGGQVLVVGGDGTKDTAELYTPGPSGTAGTWIAVASPACGRTWHTATLLPNGQVLIAGGTASHSSSCLLGGATSPSAQASMEFYDPTSNTWDYKWVTATAPAPQITPLPLSTATPPPVTTIPATPPSVTPPNPLLAMSTARYNHSATYVPDNSGTTGGWVLIAGGFDGNVALKLTDVITITPSATPLTAAPAYVFNTTPINLSTASFSHSATLLTAVNGGQGGQVLLAGGSSGTSAAALARAELIDLTSLAPAWAPAGQLTTPRVRHIAQLLSDGATVLFSGGATNSNSASSSSALASVEIYSGGTFTANGNLAFARDALSATPISVRDINGNTASQVLLVGGQGVTAAETFQ